MRTLLAAGFTALLALPAAAGTNPADMKKVLHTIIPAAETGFDPAIERDLYSSQITQAMYEALYTYDYMARPVKLVPGAAAALPEISEDGKTYIIRLKKGVYFAPDPAFGGKRRELTMADFIYSWKRLLDPKLASPHAWLLENKIVGLDALAAEAKKTGKYNIDAKVAGFELLDPYTLRIHLAQTDFNLGMVLSHVPTAAVAREVVDKYADAQGHIMSHPVGTGPYMLVQNEWVRGSRVVLTANPEYRGMTWNFEAANTPEDQKIASEMKDKKLPAIGRIEIAVMVEDQSRLLSFQSGETDVFWLDGPLSPKALINGKLRPELAAKGVQLSRIPDPEISFYYWNMRDPILGGYSKEKIALRRAIAMAHNVDEEIRIVWNGEAQRLDYPIPPGVVGYDPNYRSINQYNPALANALLDKFGYKKGADGYRTLPDGKPLTIRYTARAETNGVLQTEMWRKSYNSIGIRMEGDRKIFSDILKAEKECKLMTRTNPWIADFPDGDNFMMLFYGPNIHQNNNGCFQHPEYDKLYAQTQKMRAGPERDKLYRKMARIIEVNAGMLMGYARYRSMLAQPTVLGFKKHPILTQEWMYIDKKN
ncbi:MAG TPA: ABC transporter substrate-binding protein [Burkholderiaceae bacterium]